jgi:ABC-type branched-subunit amino acid transport system ATPase component
MEALLSVAAVTRSFGGLRALDGCSFALRPGQVTCLVGPNGAGKTTVFDCITGFLKPDAGSIRFDERPIAGLRRREIVRLGIARSFQNLRLFEEMTVIDNVIVCLSDETGNDPITAILRPFHSRAVLKRKTEQARAILDTVGLLAKADHAVTAISFGQQKLLCIARVLATDARLLLLDEPTSGLGATALDTMVALIRQLSGLGKTLLVVEHNTRIVRDIADEVVFMHQGRVLAAGDPTDVLERRDLAQIYFGGGH